MAHHVIYIHGFGDSKPDGQNALVKLWRVFGVRTHYSPVYWAKDEAYKIKLGKLLSLVDQLSIENTVSVIGVSAGASMAMNIYAERKNKINRVIFIVGKLLYPETVQESIFQKHPVFRGSVFAADENFKQMSKTDKNKMLTMYALVDNTVPILASMLPGVKHKRILALGHIPAIYIAITFYSYSITKFIKS